MGVRGLSSFFGENPALLNDFKLHNTKVVIDGNNLAHLLYSTRKVDCMYGGDYQKFAEATEDYFQNFLCCNVEPIVIFDGCYDKNDRKLKTVLGRIQERLNNVRHIRKYGACRGNVFPILAMEVMRNVLQSMNITFWQCDFEADDEIAAIANYYQCPVISQDSDFYIFDINRGVIRLDSIHETALSDNHESDTKYYLKCKIYFIDEFLSHFPDIRKEVLPLFGTLIGNDYVNINIFDNFYANIKLPKYKAKLKVNQRHKKMIGLLKWLENRSVNDAIELVLRYLKLNERERVQSIIKQAVAGYELQHGQSRLINPHTFSPDNLPTTFHDNVLPDWFVERSRAGRIPPFILHAICLHKVFLKMQVEEEFAPSSYMCSQYIRQVLYGIFLSYDAKVSNFSLSDDSYIVEFDQCNGKMKKNSVLPILFVDGFGKVPSLDDLHDIDAKLFLVSVFGDKLGYLDPWPRQLMLLAGIIRYWLRNCTTKPTEEFFTALLVHIIYFGISDCSGLRTNKLGNSTEIGKVINSIDQEEVLAFQNKIGKHLRKPLHTKSSPVDISIIHSFSELQPCILYLLYLNELINSPLPSLKMQHFFGGTMLYNLTKDILSRQCPELYAYELLGRGSNLNELFLVMKEKLLKDIPSDCFSKAKSQRKLTRKKKKIKGDKQLSNGNEIAINNEDDDDDITSLCNKFDILNSVTELNCEL